MTRFAKYIKYRGPSILAYGHKDSNLSIAQVTKPENTYGMIMANNNMI